MRVVACVINWNTAHDLPGVVAALREQEDLAELVVIDNASSDNSLSILSQLEGIRVIANDQNLGFAGAANQGVALAVELGAEAILICNPDVRLKPDYVQRAATALGADPRRASVAGKLWRSGVGGDGAILDSTGHLAFRTRLFRNRGEGQTDVGQYDEPGEVFGVSGAAALYRLAALQNVAINGEIFDEDLFAFFEDVDMDWRLRRQGWTCWYEPQACGWHERGGAGPRRSAFVEELNFANRFLLLAKNDDPAVLWRDALGLLFTSLLKAIDLAVTEPAAFRAVWPRLRGRWHAMRLKQRHIAGAATVANSDIVDAWFQRFDYLNWIRTWYDRTRGARSAR